MELGMIGLGRMGSGMTERLLRSGHRVVVHDVDASAIERVVASGAVGTRSIDSLLNQMKTPRAIWLMVPSGEIVERTMDELAPLLNKSDVVIDGGNSNYKDTVRRASVLAQKGIDLIDAGTSGGIRGIRDGYCLMIGGAKPAVERLKPIFESLAPSPDRGWAHVGPPGAGHFVKMVHNGIEYGLMQAYAEGFALLDRKADFDFDLHQIAEVWRNGSVVRSWLLDLTAEALADNPSLDGIRPHVSDSGEARWMVVEAIEQELSIPVIALSLFERLRSRDDNSFADRLLAVMRYKFGGHEIKKQ
jgi:6-phosphogluconate dehydrogenase